MRGREVDFLVHRARHASGDCGFLVVSYGMPLVENRNGGEDVCLYTYADSLIPNALYGFDDDSDDADDEDDGDDQCH